jgi:murein DD-endopeptidase MepM/ murein hydrolase activator NlpD
MIHSETVQKAHRMGQFHKIVFAALALCAAPLVAGCMPDTPETQLTWDANTRMTKKQNRIVANDSARTYAYQDKYAKASPNTYAKPTPRPEPRYVARDVAPYSPSTVVTSQPLAPVGNAPAFAWPLSGRVIADFGATNNGGKNDGINIATAMDAPIHASASGSVTYAGDELKGYGNLVLVKHAGGFTTAYAHADRLVVSRGDFVAKGQVIGYSGQTGDVTSPQLHFEIRNATTPLNPRSYLSTSSASN